MISKLEFSKSFPIVCFFCGDKINNVHQRHNAQPVADAWCCSSCNTLVVIPRRIKMMLKK